MDSCKRSTRFRCRALRYSLSLGLSSADRSKTHPPMPLAARRGCWTAASPANLGKWGPEGGQVLRAVSCMPTFAQSGGQGGFRRSPCCESVE
eukprot:325803-Chlamydomonas_euryale.AAC.12